MSIEYCEKCHKHIDTDYNAEHFADDVEGCEDTFTEKTSYKPLDYLIYFLFLPLELTKNCNKAVRVMGLLLHLVWFFPALIIVIPLSLIVITLLVVADV